MKLLNRIKNCFPQIIIQKFKFYKIKLAQFSCCNIIFSKTVVFMKIDKTQCSNTYCGRYIFYAQGYTKYSEN